VNAGLVNGRSEFFLVGFSVRVVSFALWLASVSTGDDAGHTLGPRSVEQQGMEIGNIIISTAVGTGFVLFVAAVLVGLFVRRK
jgi:hypothetical protein